MKSSRLLAVLTVLYTAASYAAHVDMTDPKRALGREDDIRVDAQLYDDNLAPNGPINVVYQVHNLTQKYIAIADKVCDSTYDPESSTIIMSIGAEVPDANLPHLVTIAPGEKKVLKAASTAHVLTPTNRTPFRTVPRYVQIRVNILRDATPFQTLIARQVNVPQTAVALPNDLFDRWLDVNDGIDLNAIPVQWSGQAKMAIAGADQQGPGGGF